MPENTNENEFGKISSYDRRTLFCITCSKSQ